MRGEGTHHRDAIHDLFDPRQEVHREVNAGRDLPNDEILRYCWIVLEFERVEMTDGARDFIEDYVTGASTRLDLRTRPGGMCPWSPQALNGRSEQTQPSILQQFTARRKNI